MLSLGNVLVSLCDEGHLKTWNLKRGRGKKGNSQTRRAHKDASKSGEDHSEEQYEEQSEDEGEEHICDAVLESGFVPTALAHPPTYLNKVMVGSEAGTLQLWNVRTGR